MITIRELKDKDMLEAIKLKEICWPEELAGMSENKFDLEKEYLFWTNWMHNGFEYNDVRILIGAFDNEQLLGVAFASFAENEDSTCGIELNGLWVYPNMRGRGISLMLMTRLLHYYEKLGMKELIIYNYHNSSSNSFYRKFGAKVFKTELQIEEQVPTDIFKANIIIMKDKMIKSLEKYNEFTY